MIFVLSLIILFKYLISQSQLNLIKFLSFSMFKYFLTLKDRLCEPNKIRDLNSYQRYFVTIFLITLYFSILKLLREIRYCDYLSV